MLPPIPRLKKPKEAIPRLGLPWQVAREGNSGRKSSGTFPKAGQKEQSRRKDEKFRCWKNRWRFLPEEPHCQGSGLRWFIFETRWNDTHFPVRVLHTNLSPGLFHLRPFALCPTFLSSVLEKEKITGLPIFFIRCWKYRLIQCEGEVKMPYFKALVTTFQICYDVSVLEVPQIQFLN